MHLCLQITEILTNIFNSYDDNKQCKTTLLHLAFVCKIFHEPALDALWRFQRSFLTLVKIFPRDLWEEIVEHNSLTGFHGHRQQKALTLTFKRPLVPLDWPRFQLYARRMKHLSFDQHSRQTFSYIRELSPSVFSAIELSLNHGHSRRPLLRNLSELTCIDLFNQTFLHDARMFLGRRLTKLDLVAPSSLMGFESFLAVVKSRCPSLKNLRITDYGRSEKVGRAVSDLICDLWFLQEILLLDVTLNCKALVFLAALPMLRRLHVSLPRGHELQAVRDDCLFLPFPALKIFHVCVASIADASGFLQFVSSPSNIESLSIETSTTPPSQELYTFFATVHQSSSRTLTAISLRDFDTSDTGIPHAHSLIDAHLLSPLLQCSNLESILFHTHYGQEAIDNSLIKDMSLAWPRLRNISFSSYHSNPFWHSKANLEGLIHLAQHCLALESICLQFDVSLPTTSLDLSDGIRNESLTHLGVHRSRITTDPLAIAIFLSDIFPNMELEHDWQRRYFSRAPDSDVSDDELEDPAFIEMCKCWEDVDKLLESRRQEILSS